jgi:hypothetical protein
MRIFKLSLKNKDGSLVSHEQLAELYGAENVQRFDSALVDRLPDGELTPEQGAILLAAVKPVTNGAIDG